MYPPPYNGSQQVTVNIASEAMKRVFLKMTLGLVITALVSIWASSYGFLQYFVTHTWVMWVLIIAIFGVTIFFNSIVQRVSNGMGTLLFVAYAALFGLWLSPIMVVYTGATLVKTFFITAGTFGAMAVYGYSTSRDLTRIGSLLFMALIGLIIAMLVNIFLRSDTMQYIISIAGVLIFVGLTAWDTQNIKRMAQVTPYDQIGRLATIGALQLYLDFINLFLFLLRIFGGNRN